MTSFWLLDPLFFFSLFKQRDGGANDEKTKRDPV